MQKKQVDIVNEVLELCIIAYPVSTFIISLYKQYGQRGFLTKKQLEGLLSKASKIEDAPAGKLATLEALIKKMPTRSKSELPESKPLFEKDLATGEMIKEILAKYPQHKRVLFLQTKYNDNQPLSPADVSELKRFKQLLK